MIYKLHKYIYKIIESLKLILRSDKTVQLNCWMELNGDKVEKRNLGDELNFYLISILTGKHIVNRLNTISKISDRYPNYVCIGSLVEEFTTNKSIIWGAGAIEGGCHPLRNRPAKVLAVRGKLTRQYLLDNGVDCPEVYGDPALLTPLVYNPVLVKKYKIGVIPHVSEIDHPYVQNLVGQGIKLIRLDNYDQWTDVIDQILSCEFIISSSLHGLILSDAYSIPNHWIAITDSLLGGHFKFKDYFSGVGRQENEPFRINVDTGINELFCLRQKYSPLCYNTQVLIESAPWPISDGEKRGALKNNKCSCVE